LRSTPPGPVEVHVLTLMGGVEIIVPPQLAVESDGVAIMGGFDHAGSAPAAADAEATVLRIHGFAVMGGVEIKIRLPGESERDARKRKRAERKQLREKS
jgi:hypothetical protein